jgi:restriction system protein
MSRYRRYSSGGGLSGIIFLIIAYFWFSNYAKNLTPTNSTYFSESTSIITNTLIKPFYSQFWPVFMILITYVIVIVIFDLVLFIQHQIQLSKSGISEIDNMDGHVFEEYLATLFQKLGYKIEIVGHSGSDFGTDLVIEKDGIRTAVQAKRQKSKVGEDAVRDVCISKNHYKCLQALVVTNSFYTPMAKILAKDNKVDLWNRYDLIREILNTKK